MWFACWLAILARMIRSHGSHASLDRTLSKLIIQQDELTRCFSETRLGVMNGETTHIASTYCATELRRLCQNGRGQTRLFAIWRITWMIHVLISGILLEKYMSSSKCDSSKFPLARSALSNKRPKWMTKTKCYTFLDHPFSWLSRRTKFTQNPIASPLVLVKGTPFIKN